MPVIYEKRDNIALITLNRPRVHNAINMPVIDKLNEALMDFQNDDKLMVAIITGAGDKAFCVGADIKNLLPYLREIRTRPWAFPTSLARGNNVYKPLIAAVNGSCIGGGFEIALACDLRIASENASFALTDVKLGPFPARAVSRG